MMSLNGNAADQISFAAINSIIQKLGNVHVTDQLGCAGLVSALQVRAVEPTAALTTKGPDVHFLSRLLGKFLSFSRRRFELGKDVSQ